MDRARYQRVGAIFDEAAALPPDQRPALVDQRCGDDAALRTEVEALLAAHARAGSFLESAAALAHLPDEPAALEPGQQVGVYRIEREIARGGMGVVYEAIDERLGRRAAVKALSPALQRHPGMRERLRREARAVARLSHPSIATVYALEERGDALFIVSEFVDGHTLRERLDAGPLDALDAVTLALRVAEGLAAAHEQGIVHRDLKPENVMVTPGGAVKILDFGIAHLEAEQPGPSLTFDGLLLGTPGYMAPEQLRGGPVDARADLFALGAVLHEMITGTPPFGRGSSLSVVAATLEQAPPPPSVLAPNLPEVVDAVVNIALQKDTNLRYPSAIAMAGALEESRTVLETLATGRVVPLARAPRSHALWWWQFHELAAATVHSLMMVPAWQLVGRLPGPAGRTLFFGLLSAAAVTGIIRLHLWFVSLQAPERLAERMDRLGALVRWGDRVFAALLAIGGLSVSSEAPGYGALLMAFAVGSAVASHIVEPSSADHARGALKWHRSSPPSGPS
jgi:hypothetical protein